MSVIAPNSSTYAQFTVDNILIDLNTISSSSGAINLTPIAGSAVVIDGVWSFDAGVCTALSGGLTFTAAGGSSVTVESVTFDGGVVGGATLTTPNIGVATATSVNKITITAPATGATLTLAEGSSIITSGAYALTLTMTGATGVTLPTTGTLATLAGTETLSGKTLTSPKIANGGYLADANGNELIVFTSTGSAVNEFRVVNAATTGAVKLEVISTSADTAVSDMEVNGKAGGAATVAGGAISITAGAGNTTGAGGAVALTAGAGGNDAVGGAASLVAGAAGGGDRAGGQANVTAGAGQGTAAGGAVVITSGASENGTAVSPGASGAITLAVGAAGTATTGTAGAGGTIALTGVAGGASTGASSTAGAGSSVNVTAGAGGASSGGGDTGGAGGNVVLTAGAGGSGATAGLAGAVFNRGLHVFKQGAIDAKTTSVTLTVAEVINGLLSANQGAAGAAAYTLPTGTQLAAALPATYTTSDAFYFRIVNISTNAAEIVTLTGAAGTTVVGNATVAANDSTTTHSFGTWLVRMTGANAFSFYRVG